jgi:hypothetical protein
LALVKLSGLGNLDHDRLSSVSDIADYLPGRSELYTRFKYALDARWQECRRDRNDRVYMGDYVAAARPMFANDALARTIYEADKRKHYKIYVIDLANESKNVRDKIERRNDINDRSDKQGLFGRRHSRVLQKSAQEPDQIGQKHQEALHSALELKFCASRAFYDLVGHRFYPVSKVYGMRGI